MVQYVNIDPKNKEKITGTLSIDVPYKKQIRFSIIFKQPENGIRAITP